MASFQLRDGSRFYYDAGEVHKEVFLRGMDFLKADSLEDQLEPQEVYRKLTEAKEPAAVLERFTLCGFRRVSLRDSDSPKPRFFKRCANRRAGARSRRIPRPEKWPPGLATWIGHLADVLQRPGG